MLIVVKEESKLYIGSFSWNFKEYVYKIENVLDDVISLLPALSKVKKDEGVLEASI
jgi:hypothetical protein